MTREKHAYQLILEGMESASEAGDTVKAGDALLSVLEKMKLPKKRIPEIVRELERFNKELCFTKEQWIRIDKLITELKQ